jgi:2-polyprenyl-3-methyl-5-hydroxy-6-metoxy-1,4-benzoquinol methylase
MIGNRDEYESMFQVERKLWWYRILHQKVIRRIQGHFPESQSIHIVDAGCGTGGLLDALRQAGYARITGFDASVDAVSFARERQVAVELHDLRAFASFYPGESFDVIICNDVLCYFKNEELVAVLDSFRKRLRPGGIFISNNNAFPALRGTHDIALHIPRRFVKAEFARFAPQAGFSVEELEYWNFGMTIPIWLLRKAQLLGHRLRPSASLQSDVKLPPLWMNELVFNWLTVENRLIGTPPFGSSLFMVMR